MIPNWTNELKRAVSSEAALLDRLKFHGGMSAAMIRENTGWCLNTVRKHMHRLMASGQATEYRPDHWTLPGKSEE